MPAADPQTIELTVRVDAPAATVWEALADDGHRRRWWSYLDLDARPGGRLLERWRDRDDRERTTSGGVLEAESPRLLRCTWSADDWPAETEVEIALRPDGDATVLRLRHGGWERLGGLASELRPAHEQGWRMHLDDLKRYVEAGAA